MGRLRARSPALSGDADVTATVSVGREFGAKPPGEASARIALSAGLPQEVSPSIAALRQTGAACVETAKARPTTDARINARIAVFPKRETCAALLANGG